MSSSFVNARLADGSLVGIDVDDGRISSIAAASADGSGEGDADGSDEGEGGSRIDLQGWLVLPAMAEPHAHLDKALTADRVPNPSGDLDGAIQAWIAHASRGEFGHDDTVSRSAQAMEQLIFNGVTAVRTHVNVGAGIGAAKVLAVREAADRFAGLLDVQIVALTHSPMTRSEGAENRRALDAAVEAGVDLVGGCPHLDERPAELIAHALAVATDAGLGLDLHVDEMLDPSVLTLRELAHQVLTTGFAHGVAASHCVTLGMQTPEVQAQVAAEVAEAGISVFPLPQTNLFLQGRNHPTATPRGLTAIRALQDAGAVVAAGADNVQDPFNLVGRSDPLETAALLVMAAHQTPETAFAMVSTDVRTALGLSPAALNVGDVADFVAIDAPSIRGAIADAPASRRVIHRGVVVAESTQTRRLHVP